MIDEIRNSAKTIRVKINMVFSQPLFSNLIVVIILPRELSCPLDWRKIRTISIRERMIWIKVRPVFIFLDFCKE